MAIQNRRGAYVDLNPAKAVPGELLVVQSGDPNTTDGKAVYVTFASGDIKLLAMRSDVETAVADVAEDLLAELDNTISTFTETTAPGAVADVADEGAAQITAIGNKGDEVLGSIPSDYSTLSGDVSDLKSALKSDEEKIFEEINITYTTEVDLVAGRGLNASQKLIDVDIPNGVIYTFTISDPNGYINSSAYLAVYEMDSQGTSGSNVASCKTNREYEITASKNVKGISLYSASENIVGSGKVQIIAVYHQQNDNTIESAVKTNTSLVSNAITDIDLINIGSVHPDVTWENGAISTSSGEDINHTKQRRTKGYIDIKSYSFTANLTNPNNVSLAMYLLEYNASKTYLGATTKYVPGDLTPENPNCRYVRVTTYSETVPQADQDSYITLTLVNSHSISNVEEEVSQKLWKNEYDNALHAFDLLESNVLYRSDEVKIGATYNNDSGNTTYIYKRIVDTKVVGCVWIRIKNIENARNNSVVIYYYNNNDTLISSQQLTDSTVKNGIMCIPPEGTVRITVLLYPSISGGLTDTYAIYDDIIAGVSNFRMNPLDYLQKHEVLVPYYYFVNDYLKNKISTIRGKMVDAEGNYDAFIFCTDQHWRLNAKKSPSLIKYISMELNIKRLFMGGDYADGINMDALKAFREAMPGKIYNITGNHEYMNYFEEDNNQVSETIDEGHAWIYLNGGLTDAVIGDAGRQYYYVDNPAQKMRYIVLNVYKDNGQAAEQYFSSAQKTWLQNTALNLPTGYTAIVFSHASYVINGNTWEIGDRSGITTEIAPVLDAYNGSGKIACWIAGHSHVDGVTTTPGGIPVFITTCDKYGSWISGGVDQEPWLTANRHLGTITEQAFDVVVVDKTNKLVSLIRIGAPADNGDPNDTDKLEIRQQSYGT